MQTKTVNLIDYQSSRVNDLSEFSSALEPGRNIRLFWHGDNVNEISGFAFKPVFSYEHNAVSDQSVYKASGIHEGWFEFVGEQGDASNAMAELLDATLWRGRPVLQGRADYWMAVDLNGRSEDYDALLEYFQSSKLVQAIDAPKLANELRLENDHNLIAPVWRLLGRRAEIGRQSGQAFYYRAIDNKNFAGTDESKQTIESIGANVDLYLWFMDEQVLLVQWRVCNTLSDKVNELTASLNAGPNEQSIARGAWLDLLMHHSGCDTEYRSFGNWLSVHQSLRWQGQSFKKQVDEGRLLTDIKDALFDSLRSTLTFCVAGKGKCGDYILSLADTHDEKGGLPTHMGDPRFHSSWAVSLLSMHPGQRFNGALQRAWAHLLGNDTPFDPINDNCDNYAFDKAFTEGWVDSRTYKRWADTGIQYGFSEFSAAAMGTSWFFRNQVFNEDLPGLYSELTRLCLFQQTRLRALAMAFSLTLGSDDGSDFEAMQKEIKSKRDELQRFNRKAWFHRVSTQLQPEELYQQQKAAMDLDGLYLSVRDEFEDVSAWLAAEESVRESEKAKRQQKRDWGLGVIGLAIAVPGLLQIWGAGEPVAEATSESRSLLGALWAMFCSLEFWLFLAVAGGLAWDHMRNNGGYRKQVQAWLKNLFSR